MDDELMREIERYTAPGAVVEINIETTQKLVGLLQRARDRLGWIPVIERLPEDGFYLCRVNDIVSGWHEVLQYGQQDYDDPCCVWMKDLEEFPAIVTHWMPLPPPPDREE